MGEFFQKGLDIGWLHHLEEFVRGVVLQATDSGRGVEEREALLLAERHNIIYLETLGFEVHKVVLVAKEYLALDAPVVVDKVRVIEVDAPPLALGRETTQEQHLRVLGQEGAQGVVLYPSLTAGNIRCIQIRGHRRVRLCGHPAVQFLPECRDTDADRAIGIRLMNSEAALIEILLTKMFHSDAGLE